MKPKLKYRLECAGIITLIVIIGLGIMFLTSTKSGMRMISGWVIYEGEEPEYNALWDFSNESDYIYDGNLVNISGGGAKIVSTTEIIQWNTTTSTEHTLVSALYNPSDKTDKIEALDNKKQEVNENKIFDVFFGGEINNGETISLYIDEGQENIIYLCDLGVLCDSSNYGSVSYDGEEGWYNITLTGLSSPTEILNIHPSDNLKVNYITSTAGEISKALYNPEDKTDKVNSLDTKKQEVNKDKIFNLLFNGQLENGDIVSLYIEDGSASEVFLCSYGEECSSPGYGTVNYDGSDGWYNLTVAGLDSPSASFNLDPDNVKINHIKAARIETEQHSSENITYPGSAEIQTHDIEVTSINSWGSFSKTETLNGQSIGYFYSLDSGTTWMEMPDDDDLSSVSTESGKIRFKAVLNSNGTATPRLNGLSLNYTTQVQSCTEDWSCDAWNPETCPQSEVQTRTCTDINECGTEEEKPLESQSCTYQPTCSDNIKNQDETDVDCGGNCGLCEDGESCLSEDDCVNDCVNNICGVRCIEQWGIVYGECLTNNFKLKYYADVNNCGTTINLPVDNGTYVECDYCVPVLANATLSDWLEESGCLNNNSKLEARSLVQYDINNCGEVENITYTEKRSVECDYCTPNWVEVNGSCWPGNTFISWFNDTNNCYALTGLNFDTDVPVNKTYLCNYCALHNCTGSFGEFYPILNNSTLNVNAVNGTKTLLEITSEKSIKNTPITLVEYSYNPKNETPSAKPLDRYLEIESGERNISSVKIVVYYTDEEIEASDLNENSLQIHYYNETSEEWERLNSTVNTTGNYVYAEVDHLSLYGVFGSKKETPQEPTTISSWGGGGGGGRRVSTISPKITLDETKKPIEISKPEIKLENKVLKEENIPIAPTCNYTVEIELPETISFVENGAASGRIINKGNCDIDEITLSIDENLADKVTLSKEMFTDLKENGNLVFEIVSKQYSEDLKLGPTGFIIKEVNIEKTYEGYLTSKIISQTDNKPMNIQKQPISIKVVESMSINPKYDIMIWFFLLTSICCSAVILVGYLKKRKKRK